MAKTYLEPQTVLPVYDECDVLVVGGGSAGHSAAIAAARAGCKNIILMERYGYMGGDVTGGYVLMVPKLSWYDKSFVRGIQEEWFTRLNPIPGAVLGPDLKRIGQTDPALIDVWQRIHGCVSESDPKRLVRAVYYEPNELKIEMDKMLMEEQESIRVMCHCWGTKPIMEGNVCKGVIFESKEGRKAVLAKIVIDATGDADLVRQSGAPTSSAIDDKCRCSTTALVYRIGGFSWQKYWEWKEAHPAAAQAMSMQISRISGFMAGLIPGSWDDCAWMNNWHANKDCSLIKDQTQTEMETRLSIREVLAYLKEACPYVFDKAYLYDIAPQLGTRGSHRIVGDYIMTHDDWAFAKQHEDVIAWHSTVNMINDCAPVEIPYATMLPKGVENILAPGRHISADRIAIDCVNLIPQCVGTGQAAGVAAAVAVAQDTTARMVDIKRVQDILAGEQDVPLPRNEHTDKSYTECCEEHQYGLYTEMAQKARENKKDEVDDYHMFRVWDPKKETR